MAELTENMKLAIVRAHAQFMSPPDIRIMMREEYGQEIELRRIHGYNPQKTIYDAGERLRTAFEEYRRAYMEDMTSHDIANPAYRIGMLDRMAKRAEKAGNMKLAAELAEQAAKEVGGAFTNERRVTGTIDHRHRPATIEDARAELSARLKRAQEAALLSGQDVATSGQGEHGVAQEG